MKNSLTLDTLSQALGRPTELTRRRIEAPEPVSLAVRVSAEEAHGITVGDRIRVIEPYRAAFPCNTYGEVVALNGRELGYRDDILVRGDKIPGQGCFKTSEIRRVPTVDTAQFKTDPQWVNWLLEHHGTIEVWNAGVRVGVLTQTRGERPCIEPEDFDKLV